MEIESLSKNYKVRRLTENDIEAVYKLCSGNALYYEYCPPCVTKESIQRDMTAVPPGFPASDMFYIGFYDGERLLAVMDLLNGYPRETIAYIGFFMVDSSIQKKGIGTSMIAEACEYLKAAGFYSVQLAWVKGNPQAEHFWMKNHFIKRKETSSSAAESVILAERIL